MPTIYVDEAKDLKIEGSKYFLYGAIIESLKSKLALKLKEVRLTQNYFYEIHTATLKEKERNFRVLRDFVFEFLRSDANLRLVLIKDDPNFSSLENWKVSALRISQLLKSPFFHFKGNVYQHVRNPRIFIDEQNFNRQQEQEFKKYFKQRIKDREYPKNIKDPMSYDSPIVEIVDSKCLDQLQLCDILICLFRKKILDETKKEFYNVLIEDIETRYEKPLTELTRFNTRGKINYWQFNPKSKEPLTKTKEIEAIKIEDIPF